VSSAFEERFRTLLTNNQSDRKKIALPSFEGITMLNINEIVHCSSDGSYTTFYTIKGKKIVVSKPIREYDELLSPHNFFRVHQSHLVNLSYVEQFLKEDGGTLIMTDSSRIEVSRRRKDLLMEILLKNGL
jgi:two-component system LytT family response regulator